MTTLIYMRVSSERQAQTNGVESQRETVEGWCRANGFYVDPSNVFVDSGFTGTNMDRPEWRRLNERVAAGGVNAVVAYSLDRIGRSVGDVLGWFEKMEKRKVRVILVKEGWDTSTAMSKLIIPIMAAVAAWQRDVIVERTRDGIRAKMAESGRWGGSSKAVGEAGGPAVSVEDRETAVGLVAQGFTLSHVAARYGVNVKTVRRWVKSAANHASASPT